MEDSLRRVAHTRSINGRPMAKVAPKRYVSHTRVRYVISGTSRSSVRVHYQCSHCTSRVVRVKSMESFYPFDWFRRSEVRPTCQTALSVKPSLEDAIKEIVESLERTSSFDLAIVFASTDFASDLNRLLPILQSRLKAAHWVGCVGGGVIGTNSQGNSLEIEREPALSVTLLRLPGAYLQPFELDLKSLPDLDGPSQSWKDWVGIEPEKCTSMLLFVDPSSIGINDLLSGLDYAYPNAVTLGGIAGPHNAPHGSLFLNDRVVKGAIGLAIGGEWMLEALVAKGCRPIGPVFSIEQCNKNVLLELSHKEQRDSPAAFLQQVLSNLSEEERDMVRDSLFLGVECSDLVISGVGSPRAQATFLVRNLIGIDPTNGAVAVADRLRAGQNVQFQLREAESSRQQAEQLLKASLNRFDEPPLCGLLFACLGRGTSLYGSLNGDVAIAREVINELPIAGVFCNGEIGPVGVATHIHAYTACWGLLRRKLP